MSADENMDGEEHIKLGETTTYGVPILIDIGHRHEYCSLSLMVSIVLYSNTYTSVILIRAEHTSHSCNIQASYLEYLLSS